jgi:hypothetical protein
VIFGENQDVEALAVGQIALLIGGAGKRRGECQN